MCILQVNQIVVEAWLTMTMTVLFEYSSNTIALNWIVLSSWILGPAARKSAARYATIYGWCEYYKSSVSEYEKRSSHTHYLFVWISAWKFDPNPDLEGAKLLRNQTALSR